MFLLLLVSVAIFLVTFVLPAVVAAAITGSTDGILFYTVFGLLAMALMAIDISIGEWLAEKEIRRNEETRRMKKMVQDEGSINVGFAVKDLDEALGKAQQIDDLLKAAKTLADDLADMTANISVDTKTGRKEK